SCALLSLAPGVTPVAHADTFTSFDFPDAVFSSGLGLNSRGDIVGRYMDRAGVSHGYLLSDGDFSSIDVPGATWSHCNQVNSRGDIVGRTTDAAGVTHGFLLSGGDFTSIDFPGALFTPPSGSTRTATSLDSTRTAPASTTGFC